MLHGDFSPPGGEIDLDVFFHIYRAPLHCLVEARGSWNSSGAQMTPEEVGENMSGRIFVSLVGRCVRFLSNLGVLTPTDLRFDGRVVCPTTIEERGGQIAYGFRATFLFPARAAREEEGKESGNVAIPG